MFFKRIYTPGLAINSYILGDEKKKECVVVDPTRHVVPYIFHAQNAGLEIVAILETHVHADFVSGAFELKHQLNGKPQIYSSGFGGKKWIPAYADQVVKEGSLLKLGDLRIESLHTPGHTPEHIIWICYDESRSAREPWFTFTGDCLFVGGVGRPDLLGKREAHNMAVQHYRTLFEVLQIFPDFTEIFPAHSEGSFCGKELKTRPSSTIGYERLFNPYLKKMPIEKWIAHLLKGQPAIPSYFLKLKQINIKGPQLMNRLKTIKMEGNIKNSPLDNLFFLDVRHPEVFAASHLKGSLNIPYSSTFSQWAGWMLPENAQIGLVVENNQLFSQIATQLRIMGFDQDVWEIQLEKMNPSLLSSFDLLNIQDLSRQYPQFNSLYLLDIRNHDEWNAGHIQGSHHIDLNTLQNSVEKLPHDLPIAVLCRSGSRASLAASFLKRSGFKAVMNVRGGIQAWKQAGLPTILGKEKS